MKILIADDDSIIRELMLALLKKWEYNTLEASNGHEAWKLLQHPEPPPMAILDWMMPGMSGLEICRQARAHPTLSALYIVIVTAREASHDVLAGFEAGADDYMVKPLNREQLQARIRVGERIINLQSKLAQRIRELEQALAQVKILQGLLPICSYCKRIRNDNQSWSELEQYVSKHSQAQFSHTICPGCYQTYVKPELDALRQYKNKKNPE